eukprot:7664332-Alexandrium_andersonii.AAC.1
MQRNGTDSRNTGRARGGPGGRARGIADAAAAPWDAARRDSAARREPGGPPAGTPKGEDQVPLTHATQRG